MSILPGARRNVFHNSTFISQGHEESKGAGLARLLDASILGASHDSSERYPPPICHPGTRKDYIERLTQLGLNVNPSNPVDCITWLKGPAGVGKSAIAQSCADALHSKQKLGASFFFSRPNHRDNPHYFFTTLAYQLAVMHDTYGAHLDREIGRNPTVVKKSLIYQFDLLFVVPFSLPAIREEVGERVIIIDGLDECDGQEAQVDIVQIIANSVRTRTTPFIWIFLSRLEPSIVATFELPDIKSISQQIDLPVSREIDQEILRYLADKLKDIGRRHGLALPWPSEEKVWALVDFCGGLFACAHAIVLFIGAESPAGPVNLLDVVLQLALVRSAAKSGKHPLSALDELYTLIMERVPPAMLQTVQWTLVTTRVPGVEYAYQSANLLGLSEMQLRSACRYLHSVLSVVRTGDWAKITFYHASFMDFVTNPARSGRFCIWSDCAVALQEELLSRLGQMQIVVDKYAEAGYFPRPNLTWSEFHLSDYVDHFQAIFKILGSIHLDNDVQRYHALTNFDFRRLSFRRILSQREFLNKDLLVQILDSRLKLIKPCVLRNLWASFPPKSYTRYYTIGHGEKRALLMLNFSHFSVHPYSPRRFKKWAKQQAELSKATVLSPIK